MKPMKATPIVPIVPQDVPLLIERLRANQAAAETARTQLERVTGDSEAATTELAGISDAANVGALLETERAEADKKMREFKAAAEKEYKASP